MTLPRQLFSLTDVIDAVNDGTIRKIGVILGAGISVNSGIPDFRSSDKGLYKTLPNMLDRLTLTASQREFVAEEASRIVCSELFEQNQLPCLEFKRAFVKGLRSEEWKPTDAHRMLKALHDTGLLSVVYTQNVDGFEAKAGIPADVLRPVHGTMSAALCHFCKAQQDVNAFTAAVCENIKDITGSDTSAPAESTPILCTECGKPGVRPDVVLYGEALDPQYAERLARDVEGLDLLIVVGTSLTVKPLSELPSSVPPACYRLVVDVVRNSCLQYGRGRDVLAQGDCDKVLRCFAAGVGAVPADMALPCTFPRHAVPTLPRGKRIECVVSDPQCLQRTLVHSREATISIPSLDVDLCSHVTSGRPASLGTFIAAHVKEVAMNMQMVMNGTGGGAAVTAFLDELKALLTPAAMPWVLIVDDPAAEATLTSLPKDTAATYRITEYDLTPKESALMGYAS